MRKSNIVHLSLVLIMVLMLSACSSNDGGGTATTTTATEGEGGDNAKTYVWVLVDQMDDAGKASEESFENVSYAVDYKPGDYGIQWTYTGETDASRNIMNGETWAGRFTYNGVPETMVPGETLSLSFSVVEEENTLLGSWWVESISTAYLFYEYGSNPDSSEPQIYLKDDQGVSHLFVNTFDEEYKPFSDKTISVLVPKGVPGNKITLTFNVDFTDAGRLKDVVRTVYRYEMKEQ